MEYHALTQAQTLPTIQNIAYTPTYIPTLLLGSVWLASDHHFNHMVEKWVQNSHLRSSTGQQIRSTSLINPTLI
jgi:hypothetical protein